MATAGTKLLTAEEFFELSDPNDGTQQELVRGEVVAFPIHGFEHGEVQGNIGFLIKSFLKVKTLGRVVFESGVITERNEDTVRGPDVSYYSKSRLPLEREVETYADVAPDLCVEVIAPTNTRMDLPQKTKEYFAAGVQMVWLVDPEDRSVTVLTSPNQGRSLFEDSILDGGDVLPGFTCTVSELFE